ncbi:unnamed protein product [Symbiodinium natans]|uniref:Uncharacterized protein n=1 Tax=Symbiodinium natans TaxID=878477 RepID=A0A812MXQ0_9DINO|nr:unnamed protein product [Symbiodinium natans]
MATLDSAVSAHALADAAAQLLVDDKEMRQGLVQTLSRLTDRSEQLAAIDGLSEKALGRKGTDSRVATPAPRPRSSAVVAEGPAAQKLPQDSQSEPFIIWSPIVDTHLGVQDVEELRTKDRRSLILEIPGALKSSTSLPSLTPAGEMRTPAARRSKALPDYAPHLRRSVLNMGMPSQQTTTYMAQCSVPVQKAVDPKWSTELKRADWRNAQRIQYDNRLSASIPGSISPEMPFLVRRH